MAHGHGLGGWQQVWEAMPYGCGSGASWGGPGREMAACRAGAQWSRAGIRRKADTLRPQGALFGSVRYFVLSISVPLCL
jgi:hypothetical protein